MFSSSNGLIGSREKLLRKLGFLRTLYQTSLPYVATKVEEVELIRAYEVAGLVQADVSASTGRGLKRENQENATVYLITPTGLLALQQLESRLSRPGHMDRK